MLHFVAEAETRQNSPKSPPFFNAKFPRKFEEKIHKSFPESGRSNCSLVIESQFERLLSGPGLAFRSLAYKSHGGGAFALLSPL